MSVACSAGIEDEGNRTTTIAKLSKAQLLTRPLTRPFHHQPSSAFVPTRLYLTLPSNTIISQSCPIFAPSRSCLIGLQPALHDNGS